MKDAAIIEEEALQLPDNQRALLADRLLSSLSPTPDSVVNAWVAEATDRMEAFKRGDISAVEGEAAMADLKKRFAE